MAFWKKLEGFNGNYEGFLEKLHENHLNLPIDPNYSTLVEILFGIPAKNLKESEQWKLKGNPENKYN